MTTVHLIRHGKVHNPDLVFYGQLPGFPISEKGQIQARQAGERLQGKKIDKIYHSPLKRALQTAELVSTSLGNLKLHEQPLLIEVKTPYDGKLLAEIDAINWDVYSGTLPPNEQLEDVLSRVQEFMIQVRNEFPNGTVIGTTHGDVVAVMILEAKGLPIALESKEEVYKTYLGYGSISTFHYQTRDLNERPAFSYWSPDQ